MKLAQLLSIYPQLRWGKDPNRDVQAISCDSRQVKSGTVYVAIKGHQIDGHQFIPQVCGAGACALVVENKFYVPRDFTGAVVVVEDTRQALNTLASRFYGNPAQSLYCVGVTGTNGKTSITYLVEDILNHFGWLTGVMGTVNHHVGDRVWESQMTTPDALDLQKRLSEFKDLSARAVAFEVSSHALDQFRVHSIPFDCVVFTNLTRDHLDYHQNMSRYFLAKQILFNEILSQSSKSPLTAIINGDDPYGVQLEVASQAHRWTYGEGYEVDFRFEILKTHFSGNSFRLFYPRGVVELEVPLIGRHNVYNATAAFAVGIAAGASVETCREALSLSLGAPGRMQRIQNNKGIYVFVDYAHTDDALRSVLTGLQKVRHLLRGKQKIITVFGCGGDRDKGKRPLMGQAAVEGSDFVIVTSDNPRHEDPEQIVVDIITHLPAQLKREKLIVEMDRKKAIQKAIQMANKEDVILIAGKGHESYQMVKDQKLPFSDAQLAKEFLS